MSITNITYGNYSYQATQSTDQPNKKSSEGSGQSMMDLIRNHMNELADKIEKGETEPKIQTGGQAFTQKEWNKLITKIDTSIEDIKEEQQIRKEQQTEEMKKAPYSHLAKDGIIAYKGAVFVCDYKHNTLCLGDTSNKKNCLNIPLSDGGSLIVNRDNLDDLANAIDMFSPEDINRIMRAIAQDTRIQQLQKEIEDDKNSIGEL